MENICFSIIYKRYFLKPVSLSTLRLAETCQIQMLMRPAMFQQRETNEQTNPFPFHKYYKIAWFPQLLSTLEKAHITIDIWTASLHDFPSWKEIQTTYFKIFYHLLKRWQAFLQLLISMSILTSITKNYIFGPADQKNWRIHLLWNPSVALECLVCNQHHTN